MEKKSLINPYVAGVLLGLTLILSYAVLGVGLGASSAIARVCGTLVKTVPDSYFATLGAAPLLYNYVVFMFLGLMVGGFSSSLINHRFELKVERGGSCSLLLRLLYALSGGVLVGFASRISQGCTSGQALSGGALLITGSVIFLVSVFVAGFGSSFLFRGEWHD